MSHIKPNKQLIIKFILLCSVLAGYFLYLTYKFDILTGGIASLITWSFFVLCTPIADAGFLLDFPIRLLFGVRMVISEIVVWVVAITINILFLKYCPTCYQTTTLTRVFHEILTTPLPYWSVILLSAVGTFLSIKFGDEIMDIIHQKDRNFFHSNQFKHELVILVFLLAVFFIYFELMRTLDLEKIITSI